jgi:hypothetical protein
MKLTMILSDSNEYLLVYNVFLQLGAPIGIAISNIIANGINPSSVTKGPALLPGYHAAFYSYAAMAGLGFLITLILAPNRDPEAMRQQKPMTDENVVIEKSTEVGRDLEASIHSDEETRASTPMQVI